MKVAIMQPYFFPYIGYFQLMSAVDVFVLYDDVQYSKGGWVNRNRIREHGTAAWLTIPVKRDSISLNINQREYLLDPGAARARQRLQLAYAKAPFYEEIAPIVFDLLDFQEANVAVFNSNLLVRLAGALGIKCEFSASSAIEQPPGLGGEARVIALCNRLGADEYINAIGGVGLYRPENFSTAGLSLFFLHTTVEPNRLADAVVHLSIIDVLMFNGIAGTKDLIKENVVEAA